MSWGALFRRLARGGAASCVWALGEVRETGSSDWDSRLSLMVF